MSQQIPFCDLRSAHEECRPEFEQRLAEMFARSQWILGPEVAAFEREFAAFCGAPYCVGVANGTDAITLALRLRGIETPDQEVLTTPLTAPFTGIAILAAGAKPVFADVEEDTLLLDPQDAAARITPRTAALLPVHLYGQTCDLATWRDLAKRAGAVLIQDACQAHGALHGGRPLVAFSGLAAYSFYPTKNLGALGDGGALVLSSEADAALARKLRDGGRVVGHVSELPGRNSRLDEIQAAFLRIALSRLPAWNEARRRLAAIYDEELAAIPAELLRPVAHRAGRDHARHLYVVRAQERDRLREHLAANGVGCGIHYPVPLHVQPAFAACGFGPGDLPVAERAARDILSLPMGPHLAGEQARRVAALIRGFYLG